MKKISILVLLAVVGCSSKSEIKTVENVTSASSVETLIEKLNPSSEEIIVQADQYDEIGSVKVFTCKGCHIQCRHCVE